MINNMHQFSIITPTFNRAKYLPRIYDSLCQQGDIDFEWIIVDDGSSDNTKEVVANFNKAFEIKYVYQENSGKPTAVNYGIQMADGFISIYFDSDDIFAKDVLKTVWNYFDLKTGKFVHDCACVSGLCQYDSGEIIGDKFPYDFYVSDHIRYISNRYIEGDKCEFFITDIFKKYPYPIFRGEKNIAPSIVWNRIALTYKTLYVNKIFAEKQFLQGGLSTQNYYIMYPFGAELFHNESSIPPFRLRLQAEHSAQYILFAKMNKQEHIFLQAKNKLIFPFGLCMYYKNVFKLFLKRFSFFRIINNTLKQLFFRNLKKSTNKKIFKQE